MISHAPLLSLILADKLIISTNLVLFVELIVKICVPAVVPESDANADDEEDRDHDDIDCKFSVRLSWGSWRLNGELGLDPAIESYRGICVVVNCVVVFKEDISQNNRRNKRVVNNQIMAMTIDILEIRRRWDMEPEAIIESQCNVIIVRLNCFASYVLSCASLFTINLCVASHFWIFLLHIFLVHFEVRFGELDIWRKCVDLCINLVPIVNRNTPS